MQVKIHEATTQLSRLLDMVEAGEPVIVARDGNPVADIIQFRSTGFPFGAAKGDPLVPPGDDWWAPLSVEEVDNWTSGK